MIIDLIHNKIVAGTITSAFEKSVEENLIPKLVEKYGDTEILGIQMYEDYISDAFLLDGCWYYPLTVTTSEGCNVEWVIWAVDAESFERGIPYAYVGEGTLDFTLADNVPDEFVRRLSGRAHFCEDGLIKLRVETTASDITRLSGKYSQTFVDELARQITAAIGSAMSVEGLADSSLELSLVFASGTYMEHISENVTYRRLILSDGSSAPRDFWIKWTRLDGAVAYSVSASVGQENILFELGEDVSQKIREKEYRYLVSAGKDKYHTAMGRKNITEWREIVKRAIRRGELTRIESVSELEISPETRELEEKLASVLGRAGAVAHESGAPEVIASDASNDEFERALQRMREIAGGESSDDDVVAPIIPMDEPDEEEALCEVQEVITETYEDDSVSADVDSVNEEIVFSAAEDADESVGDVANMTQVEFFEEEEEEEEELDELEALYAEDTSLEVGEGATPANDDEAAELEAMTRLALEALKEVRAKAEAEKSTEDTSVSGEDSEFEDFSDEDVLSEEDALSEEDEETLEELRLLDPDENDDSEAAELETVENDTCECTAEDADKETCAVSFEREQDIRAELEAKIRLEYESRARIMAEEEAARLRREQEDMRKESERLLAEAKREQEKLRAEYEKLLAEANRISNEREARENARRAEEERLRSQIEAQLRQEARERERLAEAARMAIAEQRRLEEENVRRELARAEEDRRIEAERLQREAEARIVAERAKEAERIRREEEERRAAAAAAMPTVGDGKYSYTSKTVRLLFRRSVDPNITARIHEIIKATIEYYGKDKVFMKIRASVPDSQSVNLEFLQIPIEEMELLGNIIKILGNSGLGIAKAFVE